MTDVGRLMLVPLPEFRFRFLEAGGTVLPPDSIQITFLDPTSHREIRVGPQTVSDDGAIAVVAELPEQLLARVRVTTDASVQWIPVRCSPGSTTVHLRPWCTVVVHVSGAAARARDRSLDLCIRPADGVAGSERGETSEMDEHEDDEGDTRIYSCRIAAGRFCVEGARTLVHLNPRQTLFEVNATPVRLDFDSNF